MRPMCADSRRGAARARPVRVAEEPFGAGSLLFRAERERQAWHDERGEEDGQESLSGAPEGDGLAVGGVEGQRAAQVSAVADLEGVVSSFDWYLDRVVHSDRPGSLTVDDDIERATTDLHSDRFMRQPERCGHGCPPELEHRVSTRVQGGAATAAYSAR